MDDRRYEIRPFRETDYALAAELRGETDRDLPLSAEEMRDRDRARQGSRFPFRRWLAIDRRSDRAVGVGELASDPFDYHPRAFELSVRVAPARRGRGLGSRLYELALGEAERRRATRLTASVRAREPRSRVFATRRGFAERSRGWQSRLDVARAALDTAKDHEARLRRAGVVFTTLAREGPRDPRVARKLFRLEADATRDPAQMQAPDSLSEAEWRAFVFDDPQRSADGWFVAKDGDTYVAMSTTSRAPAQPDTLVQLLTCTRPGYRGRGLATALKGRVIRYARERGYRWIRTFNDASNAPILAVNRRLGFRRVVTWIELERTVGESDGPPLR